MTQITTATTMQIQLNHAFDPIQLAITDESHLHGGHGVETHFKVVLVAECWADKTRIQRHRAVYDCLAELIDGGIHALALHLFTPQEWSKKNDQATQSPQCLGGSSGSV